MEDITGFSMKDCLSLPGGGLKYFNSLRTEEDEPIYTYNDKNMRWFVRQAVYGGRVCAFKQYYKSKLVTIFENCIRRSKCKKRKRLRDYRSLFELKKRTL